MSKLLICCLGRYIFDSDHFCTKGARQISKCPISVLTCTQILTKIQKNLLIIECCIWTCSQATMVQLDSIQFSSMCSKQGTKFTTGSTDSSLVKHLTDGAKTTSLGFHTLMAPVKPWWVFLAKRRESLRSLDRVLRPSVSACHSRRDEGTGLWPE